MGKLIASLLAFVFLVGCTAQPETVVPTEPSLTSTAIPLTNAPTGTMVPRTATATPVPPTATHSPTPVPPTATPVPQTGTRTNPVPYGKAHHFEIRNDGKIAISIGRVVRDKDGSEFRWASEYYMFGPDEPPDDHAYIIVELHLEYLDGSEDEPYTTSSGDHKFYGGKRLWGAPRPSFSGTWLPSIAVDDPLIVGHDIFPGASVAGWLPPKYMLVEFLDEALLVYSDVYFELPDSANQPSATVSTNPGEPTSTPGPPTITPTFTPIPPTPTPTDTPMPTPTIALENTSSDSDCEIEALKWSYSFGILEIEGSTTCESGLIVFRLYDGVGPDATFLGTVEGIIQNHAIFAAGLNIPKVDYIAFKYGITEF